MGDTLGAVVEYYRLSSNGISDGTGEFNLGTSTLGESLKTGCGREIGFYDHCSGGNGDGKLEGY